LEIPYCILYDQGYTSLGGTTDTHPNPALVAEEVDGSIKKFRPAYELTEDREERLGRDW
jgi:FAD synthetase